MWSTYRIAYLGVTALLMGGIVFVAAEAEHGQTRREIKFADAIATQARLAQASETADDGFEKGNLSEVSAKELTREGDFLSALVLSRDQPVLIFKHSTECNISGGAYRRTAEWLRDMGDDAPPVYLVKVIEHRPVSEFIAKQTHVQHESPQAIYLSKGSAVWNADHEDITAESLSKALDSIVGKRPEAEQTD